MRDAMAAGFCWGGISLLLFSFFVLLLNCLEQFFEEKKTVLAELGITEALACDAIKAFLPDVQNYVFHFSLDKFLRDLFRQDVNAPKPNYTYLCADHQDVSYQSFKDAKNMFFLEKSNL